MMCETGLCASDSVMYDGGEFVGSAEMIRVGIGGWNYEPWQGLFYPEKLPKSKGLPMPAAA